MGRAMEARAIANARKASLENPAIFISSARGTVVAMARALATRSVSASTDMTGHRAHTAAARLVAKETRFARGMVPAKPSRASASARLGTAILHAVLNAPTSVMWMMAKGCARPTLRTTLPVCALRASRDLTVMTRQCARVMATAWATGLVSWGAALAARAGLATIVRRLTDAHRNATSPTACAATAGVSVHRGLRASTAQT